ncbi:hypothetical protein PQE75_gp025 [Bacillus phage vB_BcoS-136]|uniref:Uncharacterized protein n=1 Tax=Bacillus phage vB_BcoS-136 TaxID=2419619 RepID=A0A3G3BV95_9CAUD|nr:hypothetical protein PQE75_gp025 [Bacillus phage vB_BcoS-136]AYP68157.1 hypothetical protein vBBcoS136_00025 [Bacillus phage vB_BcoS-136]
MDKMLLLEGMIIMFLYKITLRNGNVFHVTSDIENLSEFIVKAEKYFGQKIYGCQYIEMIRTIN